MARFGGREGREGEVSNYIKNLRYIRKFQILLPKGKDVLGLVSHSYDARRNV